VARTLIPNSSRRREWNGASISKRLLRHRPQLGVIEHIGVTETLPPTYSATPLPDQRFQRLAFVGELMRVLSPAGSLFIDSPNGAFPFDFWHGNNPGSARRHKADEGFLPTHTELVQLLKESGASSVRALSPRRRLQFRQAAYSWKTPPHSSDTSIHSHVYGIFPVACGVTREPIPRH